MRYIPNDRAAREAMLRDVGLGTPEELFEVIPAEYRLAAPLRLPPPLDEPSLARHLASLAADNEGSRRTVILGGGAYRHHVPAVVRHLAGRSEFLTAYTPYQPEISQGTLQAMFEYQTMVCELTGMDVSNASLYDGASAAAEATLMARRLTGKPRVVVSRGVNPLYRAVIDTYLQHVCSDLVEVGLTADGRTDYEALAGAAGRDAGCLVVQSPNFLGVIEDPDRLRAVRAGTDALLVGVFTEAVSLGLLVPPGEWGADIVAGEGQSFGNPVAYGGPHLGILAARESCLRQMPGRLVGETTDLRGERGYVLTLSTREQHIRRDKATSNVCSNQGLCALAAAIHLSVLGPAGLRDLAVDNVRRAARVRDGLRDLPGWAVPHAAPVFNEFLAVPRSGAVAALAAFEAAGFTGPLPVGRWYPEHAEGLLFCLTETVGDDDIDRLLESAGRVS